MKKVQISLGMIFAVILVLVIVVTVGYIDFHNRFSIGKSFTIVITEDEVVDAEYIQKVLDGEVKREEPYFDLWNERAVKKLIKYLKKHDYKLSAGTYRINQAWRFDDGWCVYGPNNIREKVFQFEKK